MARLRAIPVDWITEDAWLLHLDLKDFYSQGDHHALASAASDFFQGALQALVYRVARFLMDTQAVASPYCKDLRFKLRKGLAMGLPQSTSLAIAAFAKTVELGPHGLLAQLPVDTCMYLRYVDNMLFACKRSSVNSIMGILNCT